MASRIVSLGLYHRDHYSKGHQRRVFGYEAFHWGLIMMPEGGGGPIGWTFAASDASYLDPVTFRMHNPEMNWNLNARHNSDPELSNKLIGIVNIGNVPSTVSYDEMLGLMKSVPLPIRNRHPQQSCVTWVVNAVRSLQQQGWVRQFDMKSFQDWALAHADDQMQGSPTQPKEVTYR